MTLRVDYERRGKLTRRLEVSPDALEELGPDAWLPRHLVMRDLIRGTRTEIFVDALEVSPDLPREIFTVGWLERLSTRQDLTPSAQP